MSLILASLVTMALLASRMALLFGCVVFCVILFKPALSYVRCLIRKEPILHHEATRAGIFIMALGLAIGDIVRMVTTVLHHYGFTHLFVPLGILLVGSIMMIVAGLFLHFGAWAATHVKDTTAAIIYWIVGGMAAGVLGVYISTTFLDEEPQPPTQTQVSHHTSE